MLPLWLKPSYIAIAVLAIALGVQSWRLMSAQTDVAVGVANLKTVVAEVATARAAGVEEGARRQKIAYDALEAAHLQIVAGLEADKADIQKRYQETSGILKDLAKIEQWACLAKPLPEEALREFRR